MDSIIIDSENNKTNEPQRLLLHLSDKIGFKTSHKHVSICSLGIHCTSKNIKMVNLTNLNIQNTHR